jgi:Na+-driven multidrug efflux pump
VFIGLNDAGGSQDDSSKWEIRVTLFSFFNWVGFSLSAASNTLIGQNIGAERPGRAKQCVFTAASGGALWSIALGLVFWFFPDSLLGISNMAEGSVLDIGSTLLRFLAFAGILTVTAQTFLGGLMGAGDTKSPLFIIIVSQGAVLLGYCSLVSHFGTLTAMTVWTALLLAAATRFVLAGTVFVRGRWRHIKVELGDQEALKPVRSAALGG